MADAAEEGLRRYPEWVSGLVGDEAETIAELKRSLLRLRSIEREHGAGACLVLDHPYVKRLIAWDRLGSRLDNALRFSALAKE